MKKFVFLILMAAFSLSAIDHNPLSARANNTLSASRYSYVDITKKGRGDNLIIITGVGGNIFWDNAIKEISKKYTCHIVSIKGISGEKSKSPMDVKAIENEIIDYINVNKVKNPAIMGHSAGGYVTLKTALAYLGVFSKIILIDSYPCSMAMNMPAVTEQILKAQSENFKRYIGAMDDQSFMKFWAVNSKGFFSDTIKQNIFLKKVADSDRTFLTDFQSAVIGDDLRPALNKIDAPVMVLAAGQTFRNLSLSAEQLQDLIDAQFSLLQRNELHGDLLKNDKRGYQLYIDEKANHFIMDDDKDWFLDKVLAFLSI